MKRILAGLSLALPVLIANPALADERFNLLDINHDGQVTWEEFHEVNPNMPRVAFDNIDKGGKGYFEHSEWDTFVQSHGKSMGQGMGSGVAMPSTSETLPARDAMPPVVMPPAKVGSAVVPKAAAPGAPNAPATPAKTGSPQIAQPDLPLLMPPQGKTGQPVAPSVQSPATPAAPAKPGVDAPQMPLVMPPAKK